MLPLKALVSARTSFTDGPIQWCLIATLWGTHPTRISETTSIRKKMLSLPGNTLSSASHDLTVAGFVRSCSIGRETVIGEGTEVGAHSKISQSVIGRNCRIGRFLHKLWRFNIYYRQVLM